MASIITGDTGNELFRALGCALSMLEGVKAQSDEASGCQVRQIGLHAFLVACEPVQPDDQTSRFREVFGFHPNNRDVVNMLRERPGISHAIESSSCGTAA